MTSQTLHLADGSRLASNRGSWRLDPGGVTVDVVIGDGVVTIRDPDTGEVLADQVPVAEDKQGRRKASSSSTPGRSKNDARPTPSKGDRWATLNSFVDVIAPRLTLAERAVWLVMFRYSRGGVCDTSERAIATQAGIDKVSAGKSLRHLEKLGLVWPVFKSMSKGKSSRYGLHPNPDACLTRTIAAAEARRQEAAKRREERGGDGRGRRRKKA